MCERYVLYSHNEPIDSGHMHIGMHAMWSIVCTGVRICQRR